MTSKADQREKILDELQEAVVEFNQDLVRNAANRALSEGVEPCDAIKNGLVAGMEHAGKRCEGKESFLPEVMMGVETFYLGLDILRPHVRVALTQPVKGKVVIGTVAGDRHDIGKNMVKLILEIAGFTVYDLGVDVPLDRFVEESILRDANLVCLSATMTTAMSGIPQVVDMLRFKKPALRIMIGGAALSEHHATNWGADAYAQDGLSALQAATQLLNSPRELAHRNVVAVV